MDNGDGLKSVNILLEGRVSTYKREKKKNWLVTKTVIFEKKNQC